MNFNHFLQMLAVYTINIFNFSFIIHTLLNSLFSLDPPYNLIFLDFFCWICCPTLPHSKYGKISEKYKVQHFNCITFQTISPQNQYFFPLVPPCCFFHLPKQHFPIFLGRTVSIQHVLSFFSELRYFLTFLVIVEAMWAFQESLWAIITLIYLSILT